MAMACTGGVAHPPGYPLLLMMGRAWLAMLSHIDMLPSSKLALLSSFLGAAAASMQFAAAESLTEDVACSLFAAGLFAFSNTAWKFSTQFEVFALNNIFSSSLILLTLHFLRHQRGWTPLLGSFLCGLALTNQHTIVVLVLVSIIFAVWRSRFSLLYPRRMLVLLVLFLLGLSPYCYLFVAGSQQISVLNVSCSNLNNLLLFMHLLPCCVTCYLVDLCFVLLSSCFACSLPLLSSLALYMFVVPILLCSASSTLDYPVRVSTSHGELGNVSRCERTFATCT